MLWRIENFLKNIRGHQRVTKGQNISPIVDKLSSAFERVQAHDVSSQKTAVTPIVLNLQGKSMQIQSRFLNDKPRLARNSTGSPSVPAGKTLLTAMLFAVALAACEKSDNKMTTADRVKLVEEKQRLDPEFHLQKKAGQTSPATPAPAAPVPTTVQAPPSKDSAKM